MTGRVGVKKEKIEKASSIFEGEINLMDSLFKRRVSDHLKQQISALLNCRNKNIKINLIPVQQQTNGVDCSLFVLAFCSEILLVVFPRT